MSISGVAVGSDDWFVAWERYLSVGQIVFGETITLYDQPANEAT